MQILIMRPLKLRDNVPNFDCLDNIFNLCSNPVSFKKFLIRIVNHLEVLSKTMEGIR